MHIIIVFLTDKSDKFLANSRDIPIRPWKKITTIAATPAAVLQYILLAMATLFPVRLCVETVTRLLAAQIFHQPELLSL